MAADALNQTEAHRDHRGGPQSHLSANPRRDESVQREDPAGSREDQWHPSEKEDDVRTGVIRRGVKAHCQKQRQGQKRSPDGCDPNPEPEKGPKADRHLGQRDQHADRCRKREKVPENCVQRARTDRSDQLGLNARRTVRVEEVRVRELLESSEEKREPEESS